MNKLDLVKAIADMNNCTIKENELGKLEETLLTREKSLNELEEQVKNIPKQLKEIETQTEASVTKILKEKFEHKKQLKQQQYDSSLKMHEQSINYLQNQIKSQEKEVAELKNKLTTASAQVQYIASKALDTSVQRIIMNNDEKHSKVNATGY